MDSQRKTLTLPITFYYYAVDFDRGEGSAAGIRGFLLEYASPSLESDLLRAFEQGWPVRYSPYDWSLNGASAIDK